MSTGRALRIACQEQLLPGETLLEKWRFASRVGYDAIELRGRGQFALRDRLPDLLAAAGQGVPMPTVCVDMPHFIGAFDPRLRRDAVQQLKAQLSVIAAVGGRAAMTPASYGMFSRRLPPFEPPRSTAGDRAVLLDALAELGAHAATEGVCLYLEPLNRYEDHMVNRLEQAVDLVRTVGLDWLRIVADTYHMNIEEDQPAAALHYVGHVQVSDSNRLQPSARAPGLEDGTRGAGPRRPRRVPDRRVPAARRPHRRACLHPGVPGGQPVIHDLATTAAHTLAAHWTGRYTVPSRQLYPHQWSWDSAFVAFGLRHLAPDHAQRELLSLFQAQWADGRVPHIAFDPAVPADAYYPGPGFWRSRDFGSAPTIGTTGLIQPPIHAWAAWATYQADPDTARGQGFLERLYPALVGWHRYLYLRRGFTASGLVALVHPWETGMDNSPSWDRPLAHIDPLPSAALRRHDLMHTQPAERPTDRDYGCYMRIATAYRDGGYADEPDNLLFAVEDPMTNALLVISERALAKMATVLGHDPDQHLAHADRVAAALTAHLFDSDAGTFFARDLIGGGLLREYTIAGLAPLVVPDLPAAHALVKTALGERFRLGQSHLLPSYDLTAPTVEPARYWRGPGWFNVTWLIWQGLLQQGELAHAAALHSSLLHTAAHTGLREYVNPITGAGHGAQGLSWSAAVVLDALHQRPSTSAIAEPITGERHP